jgi:hypothetical protein
LKGEAGGILTELLFLDIRGLGNEVGVHYEAVTASQTGQKLKDMRNVTYKKVPSSISRGTIM